MRNPPWKHLGHLFRQRTQEYKDLDVPSGIELPLYVCMCVPLVTATMSELF